jgi:hypothetical protein
VAKTYASHLGDLGFKSRHVEDSHKQLLIYIYIYATDYGLDGPGIESRWGEIFRACPDLPWDPPSLLYNGYRVFPGGKVRLGRVPDHSPPSNAAVMEE